VLLFSYFIDVLFIFGMYRVAQKVSNDQESLLNRITNGHRG